MVVDKIPMREVLGRISGTNRVEWRLGSYYSMTTKEPRPKRPMTITIESVL